MLEDLRTYLQMATGMTEATTAKARDAVTGLLATGMALTTKAVPAPEMMGQVQELADDLVTTSKNNREMLTAMIRSEVDKAVGRMGFVREDELAAVRRHVQKLETQVQELQHELSEVTAEQAAAAQTPAASAAAPAPAATVESGAVDPAASDTAPGGTAAAVDPGESSSDEPAAKPKKKKVILDPEAGA